METNSSEIGVLTGISDPQLDATIGSGNDCVAWQLELRQVIKSFEDFGPFLKKLSVKDEEIPAIKEAIAKKGVKLPKRYLVELVDSIRNNMELQQIRNFIIPQVDTQIASRTEDLTTFLDTWSVDSNPRKGLTRMYQDRVLLSPTHNCVVHCTWCFRDMGVGVFQKASLEAFSNTSCVTSELRT